MDADALSDYLSEAAQRPAALGRFDCVRFVAEGLAVGWGRDFRDRLGYSDRRSAVDRLRAAGGLYDAVCSELGQDLPISELRAGDIAYFPDPSIGLVLRDRIVLKAYRTILHVPLLAARSGWRTDGTGT